MCHVNKAGRIEIKKRSPQSVLCIVQRRGKEAGVEDFSPHDFRRTFISELLDNNVDISTVKKLAGHTNVETVIRYNRPSTFSKDRSFTISKSMSGSKPTPEQIRDAVMKILSSSQYKVRAEGFKAEINRYDAPRLATELLEQLALTKKPVFRENK